jgi:hypothetical protein
MNDWATANLERQFEARGHEGLFWMTLAVVFVLCLLAGGV